MFYQDPFPPLLSARCLSFSDSCVSLVELSDERGGRGGERSQKRRRGNLEFFKSFNKSMLSKGNCKKKSNINDDFQIVFANQGKTRIGDPVPFPQMMKSLKMYGNTMSNICCTIRRMWIKLLQVCHKNSFHTLSNVYQFRFVNYLCGVLRLDVRRLPSGSRPPRPPTKDHRIQGTVARDEFFLKGIQTTYKVKFLYIHWWFSELLQS